MVYLIGFDKNIYNYIYYYLIHKAYIFNGLYHKKIIHLFIYLECVAFCNMTFTFLI